ncbi:hypothetical protein CXB51_031030 [Gossypium anomalum]|uniref:Aminotransferase-like plant mobile domain-containing protein n=1 Tax=Gossypium anomalum TaxID=47600 RepID=A0A8J5YFL8_9ROSI|nr:hypothetical protein CXB51_031030 [Gossypium anomalum]
MAGELIRFDDKHISVEQMQMSVDRILQYYIRNMTGPPSPLIEDYLREAGFWHVAMIGRGCRLDPKLISALIDRWRPETHTFHLPCGECTITLEEVHLQLGLPVDGDAITGSVHSADWGALCYELLGAILDNINGDLLRNLVHLRWLLKLVDFRAASEFSWGSATLATLYREMCGATRPNKAKIGGCLSLLQSWARWNHSASYARLATCLEDIRLLLEQRSEAQVPSVNFAIVEIHQSDRVLRQFGFRQPILVAPEVLDDHHKIDLRQLHTDWPRFWSHYIQIWEDRYDYIPTREPIIVPELACKKGRRRRPINSAHTITRPSNKTYTVTGPNSSTVDTHSTASLDDARPPTYRQPLHEGLQEGPSGSSSFYQSPSPYGFQTPPPLMMQTSPQSLFYQGGSSSQHPQPESSPEQAEPPPEARQRRNPTRNCRRPPCGTESDQH